MPLRIILASFLKLGIIILISFFAIKCNTGEQSEKDRIKKGSENLDEDDFKYSKIEIYCWCFLDTAVTANSDGTLSTILRDCTTIIPVSPASLILPKHLFVSIDSVNTIKALHRLIFNKKESTQVFKKKLDARFLILLKKNDFEADTIVLYQSKLCYNGKLLFDYSFNVMDSIRNILKIKKIDCIAN